VGANPRDAGRLVHPYRCNLPHCWRHVCRLASGGGADNYAAEHNADAYSSIADKCCDVAAATTGTIRDPARTIAAFGATNTNESSRLTRSPSCSRQAGSSAGVARSWHANSGCERAVACAHERPGRDSRRRYPWRRRRCSRSPCVPKMPSMPFNGCRQEHAGSFARGHHGP
jgi:hypothetical protein